MIQSSDFITSSFDSKFIEKYKYILRIYCIVRKVTITPATHLAIDGIRGFLLRKVTRFGNGAKVDCPKEYLGQSVYLVILDHEE